MSYASNVAHVEGGSGTFVLPTHSPYDRQVLREHVELLAGRVPTLTLGVHGVRWTISRGPLGGLALHNMYAISRAAQLQPRRRDGRLVYRLCHAPRSTTRVKSGGTHDCQRPATNRWRLDPIAPNPTAGAPAAGTP